MVIGLYKQAEFICQNVLMDGDFLKVKQKLIDIIEDNITAENEHVPEIEIKIRHIKESQDASRQTCVIKCYRV